MLSGWIRYVVTNVETPELFVPEQIFTVTDAIGFSYGATWNTVRRNIFNWKDDAGRQAGSQGEKFLRRPAGAGVSERLHLHLRSRMRPCTNTSCISIRPLRWSGLWSRALEPARTRGLVWHTQGSGKTFTMIKKAAELLFRAPEAKKPDHPADD